MNIIRVDNAVKKIYLVVVSLSSAYMSLPHIWLAISNNSIYLTLSHSIMII